VLVSDRPDGGWHTVNGKPFGSSALPSFPGWQKPDTQTSPGVFAWGGRYVMFYDAVVPSHGKYCLSVAVSAKPEGPFTDGSTGPLVCQADLGGSIDPTPFVDGSGKPWLLWKSNDGSSPSVSQVWAAPLHDDGVSLAASPVSVMPKDDVNHPGQNTVDDPHLVVIDGVHYLFFSGGDWESPRYAVWYAVCDGPTGPCSQPRRDPILASYGNVAGPGGGNVVDDGAGRYWLSYQGWDPGCTAYACGGKRKLFVAPLNFR
jgi:beta-xylosidase